MRICSLPPSGRRGHGVLRDDVIQLINWFGIDAIKAPVGR